VIRAGGAETPPTNLWVDRLGPDGARARRNFRRADLCTAIVFILGMVAFFLGPKGGTPDQRGLEYAELLIPITGVLIFLVLLSGHFQKRAVRATLERLGLSPKVWLPIRSLRSLQAFDTWLKAHLAK